MRSEKMTLSRATYEKILAFILKECLKYEKPINLEELPEKVNYSALSWAIRLAEFYQKLTRDDVEREKCAELVVKYAKVAGTNNEVFAHRYAAVYAIFTRPSIGVKYKKRDRRYLYVDETIEAILKRGLDLQDGGSGE